MLRESGVSQSAPAIRFTNLEQTGRYVPVNDARIVVANDWDDLTTLKGAGNDFRRTSINKKSGNLITGDVWTWTNVTPAGTRQRDEPNFPCLDWWSESNDDIGVIGNCGSTGAAWTGNHDVICGPPRRLYCIEQR